MRGCFAPRKLRLEIQRRQPLKWVQALPAQRAGRPRPLGTPGLFSRIRASCPDAGGGRPCPRGLHPQAIQGLRPCRSRWSLPPTETRKRRNLRESLSCGDASPLARGNAASRITSRPRPKGRPAASPWTPRPFARIRASCPDAGGGRPCPRGLHPQAIQGLRPCRSRWSLPPTETRKRRNLRESLSCGDASPLARGNAASRITSRPRPKGRPAASPWNPRPFCPHTGVLP